MPRLILDLPTYKLRLSLNDALGILDTLMKQRHWREFDVASLKLSYVPFWLFNYDVYLETRDQLGRNLARNFGGRMAIDAATGAMRPEIVQVLESEPVEMEPEIKHNIEFEVVKPAIKEEEIKEVAKVKIGGQSGMSKDSVVISGLRCVYVPVWNIYADLKKHGVFRIEIDGLMGYPFNIRQVPVRERGFMEVTEETLKELQNPRAWVKYSKVIMDKIQGKGKGPSLADSLKALGPQKLTIILIVVVVILLLAWR